MTVSDHENDSKYFQSFFRALRNEDELGMIVRAHIVLEYELEQFTAAILPVPTELGKMEYSAKLRLAFACGLRTDVKGPLRALGALRNKFAHRIGTTISESDADAFLASFGPKAREGIDFTNARAAEIPEMKDLKLSPKDRLGQYLAGLLGAVQTARLRAQASKSAVS